MDLFRKLRNMHNKVVGSVIDKEFDKYINNLKDSVQKDAFSHMPPCLFVVAMKPKNGGVTVKTEVYDFAQINSGRASIITRSKEIADETFSEEGYIPVGVFITSEATSFRVSDELGEKIRKAQKEGGSIDDLKKLIEQEKADRPDQSFDIITVYGKTPNHSTYFFSHILTKSASGNIALMDEPEYEQLKPEFDREMIITPKKHDEPKDSAPEDLVGRLSEVIEMIMTVFQESVLRAFLRSGETSPEVEKDLKEADELFKRAGASAKEQEESGQSGDDFVKNINRKTRREWVEDEEEED